MDFSQRNVIVCVRALGLLNSIEGIVEVRIVAGIAFAVHAFRLIDAFVSAFFIKSVLSCVTSVRLLIVFSTAFFTPSFVMTAFRSTIVPKAMKSFLVGLSSLIM